MQVYWRVVRLRFGELHQNRGGAEQAEIAEQLA